MDAKVKHLEFIQHVVNRLATDSFRLKGWAVVLASLHPARLVDGGRPHRDYASKTAPNGPELK